MAKKTGKSGLRRPAARRYRFSEHGAPKINAPAGELTINRNADVALVRPKFNSSGPLVFRPLPCLDEDGNIMSSRHSASPFDFTDWVRKYPVAKYVGIGEPENHVTFLLYDSSDDDPTLKSKNPYVILQRALWRAKEEGSLPTAKWLPLIDGRNKAIPKPDEMIFMQGLIFENNEESFGRAPRGIRKEDRTQIIQLPKSAGNSLLKDLNLINEDYENDDENWEEMFINGDPVALESGRFFMVYNAKKYSPDAHEGRISRPDGDDDVDIDWSANSNDRKRGDDDDGERGYSAKVVKRYVCKDGKLSAKLVSQEERVKQLIRSWDEILHVPSLEEICVILARTFSTVPKILLFGWQDHPEFLSDEVKGLLSSRTQVSTSKTEEAPFGDDDDDDEDESFADSAKKANRAKVSPTVAGGDFLEDDDEATDDSELEPSAAPKSVNADDFDDEDDADDDDDDDDDDGDIVTHDELASKEEFDDTRGAEELSSAFEAAKLRAAARSSAVAVPASKKKSKKSSK